MLLPLALLGLQVQAELPRDGGAVAAIAAASQGLAAIQRHFTAGEVGPVTVLLESTTTGTAAEGRRVIEHLSRGFALLRQRRRGAQPDAAARQADRGGRAAPEPSGEEPARLLLLGSRVAAA